MHITLTEAGLDDAEAIHKLQVEAFLPLLEKYQDVDTNPAKESIDDIVRRLEQPTTTYYFIMLDEDRIGAIRVVRREEGRARISPVFVIPEFQGRGFGQQVMRLVEGLHDVQTWELNTIQQETGNRYLYEKMGYVKIGDAKVINDRMTIISYVKIVAGQIHDRQDKERDSD